MGGEERMGKENNKISLYSAQSKIVKEVIDREGVCYSKREYVRDKYQESSAIFLTAYDFFVKEARNLVDLPETGRSSLFLYR